MDKKTFVYRYPFLVKVLCFIYNVPFLAANRRNIQLSDCLVRKCKARINGQNNHLEIHDYSKLYKCRFHVTGDNNIILIEKQCSLNGLEIWIEDDNNLVKIGNHTSCEGNVHLACIEGQQIIVGSDCMMSADIVIRVGDSHSIIDTDGKRINPSKSICIGNHVWIGNNAKIMKGVSIADNSIIGSGAIVTKTSEEAGSVIVGNPAKVVKSGVSWNRKRIPM